MAKFNMVDKRLFQCDDADRISEALSRAIRQITLITLISETPTVAKVLTTDVVLAALMVLLTVLNMDDNMIDLIN